MIRPKEKKTTRRVRLEETVKKMKEKTMASCTVDVFDVVVCASHRKRLVVVPSIDSVRS